MEDEQKDIIFIPAKERYDRSIRPEQKTLRVAAYCRVSTDQEKQESSYEAQVAYYFEKIRSNPNWTLVGIYADDGKSATNTKKRDDFISLIEDCMEGRIDLVITKSASRFARNTVDSLLFIRKLREKNIGVIFEKEGINSLDGAGELLLTILSSQAQEESRNLSENTRWGVVRRFEKGIIQINHKRFMGYTKDENGRLAIVPEEAEVIKAIFELYIQGKSYRQICQALEKAGIKTTMGKDNWCPSVVQKMLSNEKYMGDALLQKTYTVDFLTKKRVNNEGIVPQYYIKGNHEGIISAELFDTVQKERLRRSSMSYENDSVKKRYVSKYALSNILICGECGHPYCRVSWKNSGKVKVVWRCKNRVKNGLKYCRNSPSMPEDILHRVIVDAINNRTKDELVIQPTNIYSDSLVKMKIDNITVTKCKELEFKFKPQQ